jgi:acyl-coenzyme A synthetase/AMP-(fatty) acid ligase
MPQSHFYNLFGPTETNVCLYYELPSIPSADARQVPIGRPCEHLTVELLDERCQPVSQGAEAEVCVAGPSVLSEYFRRPDSTAGAFYAASNFEDRRPRYRTGDRASIDPEGLYWFHGRRDRLIKRRGFRVELGEIESVVCAEPNVREAAAYTVNADGQTRVHVAVVLRDGSIVNRISLKAHCGRFLPAYMVPDTFDLMSDLPRTANGKVDLQRLSDAYAV